MLAFLFSIFFVIVGWLNYSLPIEMIVDIPVVKAKQEIIYPQSVDCKIKAQSAVVIDLKSGQELCSKDADEEITLASITKLVSALVFLDHNPGWDTKYRLSPTDRRDGGRIYLFSGDEVTAKDLFYNSLIASDNTAIIGLVHLTGLTEKQFVAEMNQKVKKMGLFRTVFTEPTGLSVQNKSTAREIAQFAQIALNTKEIREAVLHSKYSYITQQGKRKTIYSTGQPLAGQLHNFVFLGGKTGYLPKVGYNFVGLFQIKNQKVITVVLGAGSKQERFAQTGLLLKQSKKYY